ncbi:hypothetical protein [Novosphingobium lentum]|uniref:hypothetical protein n=1 Tax=Novosphingobium lentum TaxID=145287 RepID=UPI0008314352|nr:hypothetical protein [Novosphingobium lentum]
MMPTATQMLAAVQLALREHVTPQIEDQWAQSALRSVDVILNHLQARVPAEGPMLHQDTSELVTLLTGAREALGGGDPALEAFLAEAPALLAGYASVEDLQAINHTGREAVDVLLRACHAQRGQAGVDAVHAGLRAYLLRHAERESGFFFPTYVGRPV